MASASPFKSPSKAKRPTLSELKASRDDYNLEGARLPSLPPTLSLSYSHSRNHNLHPHNNDNNHKPTKVASRLSALRASHSQSLSTLSRLASAALSSLPRAVAALSVADLFDLYRGDVTLAETEVVRSSLRDRERDTTTTTAKDVVTAVLASARKPFVSLPLFLCLATA